MMMKRLVSVMGLLLLFAGMKAQVNDAFQGVLPVTDPMMKKSLNGEWQLKVIKGIADSQTVPAVDETWGRIPVPGCWEQYGFCTPSYDKAQPLTGYYHTTFTVPEAWKGLHVFIRFDGVLYGYDLWVNGKAVGSWRSGYNTAIFDITPYISKKSATQALALRVISQFRGSDFDYNDDWAPNGIFRDVTLMAVPKTHISDLTIRTKNTGEVMVSTAIANAGKDTEVKHEIYDAAGRLVGTSRVEQPHLWTAETPYLYTLKTTLLQKGGPRASSKGRTLQTFEHQFGFRELTIDGNILKLNGQPIKLRGVTSHSTDPVTVKVIDEASILRDMELMKEASVNYIRTSHYPREPRFYELADSLGFYIIDEVPFGYGDKNLSDSTFYPMLQQRAQATIRRDKNHPSVLIWSLGNENPLTDICVRLGDYVKRELDPSRPVCYPQVGSYFRRFNYDFPKVADIYAPHYPSTSQIADFYQRADRPVIFTEYCHTLGISLEDHDRQWDIIERTPGIAGGSVWEWVDQGMPFRGMKEDGRGKMYGYEERVFTSDDGGFEMYGNKGTDGLLYADRTPLPNYYELQHNYARAFVSAVNCDSISTNLTVTNRYDFLNLKDHVTFHWTLTNNRDTVMRGAFSPECEPHSAATYTLNLPRQSGLSLLQFDIEDAQGHTFLHQSFVLNKPQVAWIGHGSGAVMAKDATIRTGRKPTMAERLTQKGRLPEKYLLPLENSQVKADIQSSAIEGGEEISFTLTPDTADVFRSELGLAYLLDPSIDRVQWIGYGPFASYPGRHQANRYGFWAKHMDDLYFEGNHSGIDAAFLSDKDGNGILITGDSLSLNFEQTDQGIVVTVNAAVSGQGPKFAKTHFPGWQKVDKPVGATFQSYYIKADVMPEVVSRLFAPAADVPAPFRPFKTQYDTYLLKYPIPSFP
jgi:beta-galactosidase